MVQVFPHGRGLHLASLISFVFFCVTVAEEYYSKLVESYFQKRQQRIVCSLCEYLPVSAPCDGTAIQGHLLARAERELGGVAAERCYWVETSGQVRVEYAAE